MEQSVKHNTLIFIAVFVMNQKGIVEQRRVCFVLALWNMESGLYAGVKHAVIIALLDNNFL